MENKTKVFGYCRVSTDQQDNSLEVQEKRIREYCDFKHLHLVEIFVDENISGFTPIEKRPAGSKLLARLKNDAKGVVAVKPDRLFRNTIDALTTVNAWDAEGIELHVIDIGGATLATKTATGKMIFTILISFAQFERDVTAERTTAVLQNKKSSGKSYSPPVFGYDKVGGELINGKIKNQTMVPNPEEQEIINYIKIGQSKGCGPTRIAKALNRFGYRTKTKKKFLPSTIQAVMGNSIHTS